MPLHLPPLSRRDFLTTAVAALLASRAAARGPKTDPDRWALISDTHICKDRAKVHRGVRMADNLARVIAEIAKLDARPAGSLHVGDAAFLHGELGDYALVGELLNPLAVAGIPAHLMLGNHDNREHFRAGLAQGTSRPPLASRCVAVVEAARANWFLLDSLVRTNSTPGTLGKEQLDWLAEALDAHAKKPALVVVHHNPQWSAVGKLTGLTDTEALFAVLAPRQQVKALIYGHTHVWKKDRCEGSHLINLPPVAYVFQAGQPNGWVDVGLRAGGAVLSLHTLDPKHPRSGETVELAWR